MRFVIHGLPQPAGSKRAFPFKKKNGQLGVAVSDANPKARDWKNAVADEAALYMNASGTRLLEGPVFVSMCFCLPRPKGHFKKSGELRESAPRYPTVRPDTQKLARGTTDALTGIVWRDDSQIVKEELEKIYDEPARCIVSISWPAD